MKNLSLSVLFLIYWSCKEDSSQDPIIGTWNLSSVCQPIDCSDYENNCDDMTQIYIEDKEFTHMIFDSDGTGEFFLGDAPVGPFGWKGENPYVGLGEAEGITFTIIDGNLNFVIIDDCIQFTLIKDD